MDNFQLRERDRERMLRQFPEIDDYLKRKVFFVKNERSAYVSALTKIINKIARYIT